MRELEPIQHRLQDIRPIQLQELPSCVGRSSLRALPRSFSLFLTWSVSSTAARLVRKPTGPFTKPIASRLWASQHGSPTGFWRIETRALSERDRQCSSLEGRSTSGATFPLLMFFSSAQTKGQIMEGR
jgi:hypothetical protein